MSTFFENLWQMVLDSHLLHLLGGIGILLIGWLIALWASGRVSKLARKLSGKRPVSTVGGAAPPVIDHADTAAGRLVYYIIMIFALLGCFSVLDLTAAAAPLEKFISEVVTYIPNILGALLLILGARIVAGIVRSAVRTALVRSHLHERLASRMANGSPEKVAEYTAETLYYTVYLFFLPAILNVLMIYGVTQPLQTMFEKIMIFLPRLVIAVAVLVIGLWAAGLVKRAASGLVVLSRLDTVGEKAGLARFFGKGGLGDLVGMAAYVLIAIPVVISALTALQIEALTRPLAGFLDQLLNAAGNIIGAGVILFAGGLIGSFASSAVTHFSAHLGVDKLFDALGFKSQKEGEVQLSCWLGKLSYVVVLIFAMLAACDILHFPVLAGLIRDFAAFGGNVLLSIVVMLAGIWLANFSAAMVSGKCSDFLTGAIRLAVIAFTVAVAVGNMNIGGSVVEIAFALILGAACAASAIAFGIGGRETAAALLHEWRTHWLKK